MALLKSCARCGKLVTYPEVYCSRCRAAVQEERDADHTKRKRKAEARYNKKRDPRYTRFYASGDWRRLSKAKMSAAAFRCEECGAIAVEVHHIKPIQTPEGWERRLDWKNLKALCLSCHNEAHGRFGGKRHGHKQS